MARSIPRGRFQDLLEAAISVFLEQGYRRAQMADAVARAALPSPVYALRSTAEVEKLLSEAGFESVETRVHQLSKTPFACAQAEVPSAAGASLAGGAWCPSAPGMGLRIQGRVGDALHGRDRRGAR